MADTSKLPKVHTSSDPRPRTGHNRFCTCIDCRLSGDGWFRDNREAEHDPQRCGASPELTCRACASYDSDYVGTRPPTPQEQALGVQPRQRRDVQFVKQPGDAEFTAEEVGAGNEAKRGKVRFSLIDFEFVALMAEQFRLGLHSGRRPHDWQKINYAVARDVYFDALMRHVEAARRNAGSLDDDSGVPHWAAVAVNALMLWWHERRQVTRQRLARAHPEAADASASGSGVGQEPTAPVAPAAGPPERPSKARAKSNG